jgi:short-subunit dehydrogenase
VLSFSEAIANELKGTGVTVTALCPGPTETGFQKRASIERTWLVNSGLVMDAEAVAKAGVAGLMKGKTLVIPGIKNKAITFLVRLGPRNLVTRIVRQIQENK